METEILKLDRPYEYIYCNGSIGLHIATMIVYEAKTDEDGEYQLESHSHPIVKYSHRPGGTVWNRAELTDCKVLCREDNKRISMQKFYDYVSGIAKTRLLEPGDDHAVIVNAPMWKSILDLNGIEIEWPVLEVDGKQKPQDEFIIDLVFECNPEGSKSKYTCRDYGGSDIVFNGGANLFFLSGFNNRKELELLLENGMSSYYSAFKDHQFKIVFRSIINNEFDDIIEQVNSKEETIRQESYDIDV